MMTSAISARLADFIVNTRFDDIPTSIVIKTKRHILDTFGAGLAGARSDEAVKTAQVLKLLDGGGQVPLWGTGRQAMPGYAAWANGIACHAFELDDTGGCDHSGAVVIPAAMAALALCKAPISGKAFITSVVLGYDVARRALEACGAYEPHNEAGWHSTATCGTFGAAAAAGRLLGLNEEQMRWALGLAASYSGGLWAFIHDGAQSKRLHAGNAAQGGLTAALLAKEGFTGPGAIFEPVWGGFSRTFAPQSEDREAWLWELGSNWKMQRVSIKPYASCRSTHAAVDAVDELMKENELKSEDIARVEIRLNAFVEGMCGGRELEPMSRTQMSIPYAIAARLVWENVGLTAYGREQRHHPDIARVLEQVELSVDDAMAADEEPTVTLVVHSGRRYVRRVDVPLGSPTHPVSEEALVAKYRSLALMVWDEQTANRLAETTLGLDDLNDMDDVVQLLATAPHSVGVFS